MSFLLPVVIVALLNSAIATVVDRVGDEPYQLYGRAKDLDSAAAFAAPILVGVLCLSVIIDHLGQH